MIGLKYICKFIAGFKTQNCKLILGRDTNVY
jgi:hypothetical protein